MLLPFCTCNHNKKIKYGDINKKHCNNERKGEWDQMTTKDDGWDSMREEVIKMDAITHLIPRSSEKRLQDDLRVVVQQRTAQRLPR